MTESMQARGTQHGGFSGSRFERQRGLETSYVGELAHCIGFDGDVVLLELLLDLIDACGDVLGLGGQ